MSRHKLIIFFIALYCFSCSQIMGNEETIVNRIIYSSAKSLEQKGLHLLGFGGAMMHKIKSIDLHYQSYNNELDINKARSLLITTAQDLLNRVNNSNEILPYLCNYPFTAKNLQIIIGTKKDICRNERGNIALMFLDEGFLTYFLFDHQKDDFTKIYKESYEEAIQIINKYPFTNHS